MATDDSPFLSRWSRRKALVREGLPVETEASAVAQDKSAPLAVPPPAASAALTEGLAAPVPAPAEAETPPPLTLDDVAALTRESDYSAFMARGVTPELKNAALKKLFTDPHYNIMDGLDTYIEDYGKPDPLPAGWLRKMVQSQGLGLFSDDPPAAAPEPTVALADPSTAPPLPAPADEDPDLQLQPDDAARRAGPEPGPGEDAGREH